MIKKQFEFEVIVNGSSVKHYAHDGKTYIEGKKGSNFGLRLVNNSERRALFVPTIDGLSVLDGKEASFDSRGYIVDAWSSQTVDGWRTSDTQVAKFFFSDPKKSYAQKKGKGNVGVIGCAVFVEKIRPVQRYEFNEVPYQKTITNPWPFGIPGSITIKSFGGVGTGTGAFYSSTSGSSQNLCASAISGSATGSASASSPQLGTGFGDSTYSPTVSVSFERMPHPECVFEIFYNTKEALEDMGVRFKVPAYVSFPKEDSGYCEPPQN